MWINPQEKQTRLAKRLFYHGSCKERSTWSCVGKEEKQSGQDLHPSRGHRRKRGYHRVRDPPWGVRGSSYILGTPGPGFDTRMMSLLNWFENHWDLQEHCTKARLHLCRGHVHSCFLSKSKVEAAD